MCREGFERSCRQSCESPKYNESSFLRYIGHYIQAFIVMKGLKLTVPGEESQVADLIDVVRSSICSATIGAGKESKGILAKRYEV